MLYPYIMLYLLHVHASHVTLESEKISEPSKGFRGSGNRTKALKRHPYTIRENPTEEALQSLQKYCDDHYFTF